MDKKKIDPKGTKTATLVKPTPLEPNELLNSFLEDNNLVLTVTAVTQEGGNSYIKGQGFVLTDKPLLLVTAKNKN